MAISLKVTFAIFIEILRMQSTYAPYQAEIFSDYAAAYCSRWATICGPWPESNPGVIFKDTNQQCCDTCLCNANLCHIYGYNCTDTADQISSRLSSVLTLRQTCHQLNLKTPYKSLPRSETYVYMTDACPPSYHDGAASDQSRQFTIERCENAAGYASFSARVPVLDQQTGLSFFNIYCARCNGIVDETIVFYSVKLACEDDLYWPTDVNNIVSGLLEDESCNLLYGNPENITVLPFQCVGLVPPFCAVEVTSTCYHDDAEAGTLCHLTHNRKVHIDGCSISGDMGLESFSRMLRLDINVEAESTSQLTDDTPEPEVTCHSDAFFDSYKVKCRQLSCITPKALINDTCQTFIKTVTGVDFEVFLKLTPNTSESMNLLGGSDGIDMMQAFVNLTLTWHSIIMASAVTTYVVIDEQGTFNEDPPIMSTSFLILARYALFHIQINVNSDFEIDTGFIDNFLELNDFQFYSEADGLSYKVQLVHVEFANAGNETLTDVYSQDEVGPYDLIIGPEFSPIRQEPVIAILPIFGCPLVTLNTTEYNITQNTWNISIPELRLTLMKWQYRAHYESGQLVFIDICLDIYKASLGQLEEEIPGDVVSDIPTVVVVRTTHSHSSFTISILSLVCLIVSIICSLLTLLTYSLFKDMRTQPGINNMGLCISLILAQTFFLFGIGQKHSVSDWACIVLGMLIHFFALLVVIWMNVCCFHTFKIFWTLNRSRNNSGSLQITILYTMYTIVLAVCPVIMNMVISAATDHGSLGYGEDLCYISNNMLIIVTFAVPVLAVVLVNMALFVASIVKLRKTSRTSSRVKERKYFIVYCKLSTVCGFHWLFGILYMFTGNVVLEFLFIISSATQGLFIFISFVFNKPCATRYVNLCCKMSTPTPVTMETTSTTRVRPVSITQ